MTKVLKVSRIGEDGKRKRENIKVDRFAWRSKIIIIIIILILILITTTNA